MRNNNESYITYDHMRGSNVGRSPLKAVLAAERKPQFTPLEELDALIEAGYGDTPQTEIPRQWRHQKPKEDDPRAP